MRKKRFPFLSVVVLAAFGPVGPATAIGFGPAATAVVIGQPLDFLVPVRLEAGETLEPRCVRADVAVSDRAVPRSSISTSLEPVRAGQTAVRVRTSIRITEPIVTIDLTVGCVSQVARRFVVFADPVALGAAPAAAAAMDPGAARAEATAGTVITAPAAGLRPDATGTTPVAEAPRRPARAAPSPDAPARARASNRLRLDVPRKPDASSGPPALNAEALAAIDRAIEQANNAVKAAIESATASQGRIAALQAEIETLRAEAATLRASTQALETRAVVAEGRARWVWPLGGAALALALLSGWLWLRLRSMERERHQDWLAAAHAAPPADAAVAASESELQALEAQAAQATANRRSGLAPVYEPTPSELPSVMPGFDDEPPMQKTRALVPEAPPKADSRDVSAEELIDLEQQAEFFVVLGQDDAAIDLLVSHLRDTGGASPLPYLKLLDIYRRQADAAAYTRTRDRFNHRFNALAPAWGEQAREGDALEDYPAIIERLQAVWPRTVDAMAELQALLFRRDGGEMFDLPAYRELLFLYGLARDLVDEETGGLGAPVVDVLLPLGDGREPSPLVTRFDEHSLRADLPTEPVDLDLGEYSDPPARR